LLLLDEPFGALDADTRSQMQALFRRVVHTQHIAALFVTHDLKEAILVGDQYAHLAAGRLTQYPELKAFLADPASKAAEEVTFWTELSARAADIPT
jgi:putrescine transport system ATP-binding protein